MRYNADVWYTSPFHLAWQWLRARCGEIVLHIVEVWLSANCGHTLGMNSPSTTHVPFSELDLCQLFLLHLAASSVLEPNNAWPATAAELRANLKRIWDEEQLTPTDLADFPGLADRLRPLLLKHGGSGRLPRCRARRKTRNRD
jgi:hypothetical protein